MSISVFEPSQTRSSVNGASKRSSASISMSAHPMNAQSMSVRPARSVNSQTTASQNLAPYVDLQYNPFTEHAEEARNHNPVADLIPDEVYSLLRSNDMINEKAVRDYVIRRAFRELRERQNIKTAVAIEKIKEIYPYLQIDTIRKIIYRINPVSGRKVMI
jgi:hypothetical protein